MSLKLAAFGSSMYCVKGESEKTLGFDRASIGSDPNAANLRLI